MKIILTDEQKAIVDHNSGPALVFAVAGAGKTTSMIHRIQRLVEEELYSPSSILATSFSKEAVRDIENSLEKLKLKSVSAITLHKLGNSIIRLAVKAGYILKMPILEENSKLIAGRAITKLSKDNGLEREMMDLSMDDLDEFIASSKANMEYVDLNLTLEKDEYPENALKLMGQAKHNNRYYLEAFKTYEGIRAEENLYTFDDMLLSA